MKNSIEEKYKNKHKLIIIYVLFASLIVLTSFGNGLLDYIVIGLTYLLSFLTENVSLMSVIIKYVLLVLIYGSFGIISFYLFLNCFESIKYVIIYSVVINIATIVMSMVIKSFFELDMIEYLFKIIFILIGETLVFLIEFFRTKKAMNK